MSEKYSQMERLEIVMNIAYKLSNFRDVNGNIINHYHGFFSFIPEWSRICNEYIRQKEDNEYSGFLDYPEAGRKIEYRLPIWKKDKSLFVFRAS